MKKSLLALAVLGAFAGAASAQSSVTLYGIVDVGVQYDDFKRGGASSRTAIDGGLQAGNRLGFRGSEALGGGLNAVFTLEAGFNLDNGTSAQQGRLFGRQAWVGVDGGIGTLVAGRIPSFSSGTGSFDMFGAVDPFGTAWITAGLQSTFSAANSMRLDNAIAYRSPKFAGFQFGAGYSFAASGAGATNEVAGDGNNNRVMFTGANFAAGPFYAVVTYDVINFANTIAGAEDQKMLQVGATFDLKFLKLHGAYAMEDNVRPATSLPAGSFVQAAAGALFGTGHDADAWMVGLSAPLGAFTFMASYQERDADAVAGGVESDGKVYALGGKYDLSRRTNLYLIFADTKGEKSISESVAAADAANRKTIMLGVNHRF
jgi:predicted porin